MSYLRYIVVSWDPFVDEHGTAAQRVVSRLRRQYPQWQMVYAGEGVIALYIAARPSVARAIVLSDDRGIILGTVFRNSDTADTVTEVNDAESERIVRSGGRHIIDNFWGAYVAFLVDPTSGSRYVLRDPSGQVPCYESAAQGVHVFFSDMTDVADASIVDTAINWKYIEGFLLCSFLSIRDSGLSAVSELLAGECLVLDRGTEQREFYWNPADVSASNLIEDPDDAARQIRQTAQVCIDAWARLSRSVIHHLSGGLDSSIILGCLGHAPQRPDITCLNRYTTHQGEDERVYARLVASRANVALMEHEWTRVGPVLRAVIDDAPVTASPTVKVIGRARFAFRNELLRELGAECFWDGVGGDHVLYHKKRTAIAVDHVRHHGLRGLGTVVADVARLTGASYWTVAKDALSQGFFPRTTTQQDLQAISRSSFVPPDMARAEIATFVTHPWLQPQRNVPPGKMAHIEAITDIVNKHEPYLRLESAEEIHPLVAQPLMEVCLRIPAYHLAQGGVPRGLARKAFQDVVPAEILGRISKGYTTSLQMTMLNENSTSVREMLLDGLLSARGLLNRKRVEQSLAPGRGVEAKSMFPLLACIAAEGWLQQWTRAR